MITTSSFSWPSPPSLIFGSTGDLTQGLVRVKQVLNHKAALPAAVYRFDKILTVILAPSAIPGMIHQTLLSHKCLHFCAVDPGRQADKGLLALDCFCGLSSDSFCFCLQ